MRSQILRNNNNFHTFEEPTDLPGGNGNTQNLEVGDVNGDGLPDMVLSEITYADRNQLLRNDGAGSFVAVDLPGGSANTRLIALADLDSDGSLDLIVHDSGKSYLDLYRNAGSGDFETTAVELTIGFEINNDLSMLAFADLDGNGLTDIVVTCTSGEEAPAVLLLNSGTSSFGNFEDPIDLLPDYHTKKALAVAIGDVDNDGWLDVLVSLYSDQVYLLRNGLASPYMNPDPVGGGIYFVNENLGAGTYSQSTSKIALGDVDRDGLLDVVLGGLPRLLRNTGDGSFSEGVVELDDTSATHLALGDVDGDGWLDVVFAGSNSAIKLLRNDGSGAFLSAEELPGGISNTQDLAVADFDGDGYLDVLLARSNSENQIRHATHIAEAG